MWYVICDIWYLISDMWYVICDMWDEIYDIYTIMHIRTLHTCCMDYSIRMGQQPGRSALRFEGEPIVSDMEKKLAKGSVLSGNLGPMLGYQFWINELFITTYHLIWYYDSMLLYHDGSRHGTFIFWIQNQLMSPSFDHTCQGWFLGFWCSNFIRSENWYWVFPNATFQAPWHCSEPLPIASSQVRNWRIGTWTPSRRRERGLTTARVKGPWGFLSFKGGEQSKKFGILILFWKGSFQHCLFAGAAIMGWKSWEITSFTERIWVLQCRRSTRDHYWWVLALLTALIIVARDDQSMWDLGWILTGDANRQTQPREAVWPQVSRGAPESIRVHPKN